MALAIPQQVPWVPDPSPAAAWHVSGQTVPGGGDDHSGLSPGDSRPFLRSGWRPHDPIKGSLAARLKPPMWEKGGTSTYPWAQIR
jgi:hypothetical protein